MWCALTRNAEPGDALTLTAARTERTVDPEERDAMTVAAYGDAPSGAGSSVLYLLHVLGRRSALRDALVEQRRLRDGARTDVERAVARLGRALWEEHRDALGAHGRLLADVDRAAATLDAQDATRAEARKVARAHRQQVERELQASHREAERLVEAESEIEARLADAMRTVETVRERARRAKADRKSLDAPEPASGPQSVTELAARVRD